MEPSDQDVKACVAGILAWVACLLVLVATICVLRGEPDAGEIVTACAMTLLGYVTFGVAVAERLREAARALVLLLVVLGFMVTMWYAVYGTSDERFLIVVLGGFLYFVGLVWSASDE